MTPILTAQDIAVVYGPRTVVEVPHLTLQQGEVLAVIGPNGSGKSTLLRVLAALERPTRGRLFFQGQEVDWRRSLAYRRRIAVVMQEPLLLDMDVARNVAMGWLLRGRRDPQVYDMVYEWLEKFRVAHLAHTRARHLSGGEARRVALARAFVLQPDILFLDEPFAGLDVPSRESILMDLRHVLANDNITMLLVTHDRDEARALADRVVVLLDGRVHQVGTPDEVFSRPATLQVAEFVGVENVFPVRVQARHPDYVTLQVEGGLTLVAVGEIPQGRDLHACFRPEYVRLFAHNTPPLDERINTWDGRVLRVYPLGSRVKVLVQVGEVVVSVLMEYPRWVELGITEGDRVWSCILPEYVHVIEGEV